MPSKFFLTSAALFLTTVSANGQEAVTVVRAVPSAVSCAEGGSNVCPTVLPPPPAPVGWQLGEEALGRLVNKYVVDVYPKSKVDTLEATVSPLPLKVQLNDENIAKLAAQIDALTLRVNELETRLNERN